MVTFIILTIITVGLTFMLKWIAFALADVVMGFKMYGRTLKHIFIKRRNSNGDICNNLYSSDMGGRDDQQ